MKKIFLVACGVLVSCQVNPLNCVSGNPCQANQVCDSVSEVCQPALTITDITPAIGPQTGGTAITITGLGFKEGMMVQIGDTPATAIKVVSPTTITAITPTSATRCVAANVHLATGDNLATADKPAGFFYTGLAKFTLKPATALNPNFAEVNQLLVTDINGDKQADLVIKTKTSIIVCGFDSSGSPQCGDPVSNPIPSFSFMRAVDFNRNGKQGILLVPYASQTATGGYFFPYAAAALPAVSAAMPYPLGLSMINDVLVVDRSNNKFMPNELWIATATSVVAIDFGLYTGMTNPNNRIIYSQSGLASMDLTRAETATTGTQIVGILPNGGVGTMTQDTSGSKLSFTPVSSAPVKKLRVAKLNKDDLLDVVGATDNGTKFYVSLGQASGNFPQPNALSVTATSSNFEVADMTCTGNPGLIVTSGLTTLDYFEGQPEDGFSTHNRLWTAPIDISIYTVKDINGDGRPDIIYMTTTGSLGVALNSTQ